MPCVCRFNGIAIYLYYNDHLPPHFHALSQGRTIEITIQPVGVLKGSLPAAQLSQVLMWAQKRQQDLLTDWQLARAGQPLNPIAP